MPLPLSRSADRRRTRIGIKRSIQVWSSVDGQVLTGAMRLYSCMVTLPSLGAPGLTSPPPATAHSVLLIWKSDPSRTALRGD